jgi:hypothetical protein
LAHQLADGPLFVSPEHELRAREVVGLGSVDLVVRKGTTNFSDQSGNGLRGLVFLEAQAIRVTVNQLRPAKILSETKQRRHDRRLRSIGS